MGRGRKLTRKIFDVHEIFYNKVIYCPGNLREDVVKLKLFNKLIRATNKFRRLFYFFYQRQ